jgi:hypothetical protein
MTDQELEPHGARAVSALDKKIGPFERFRTDRAVSREAGRAVRTIEALRVESAVQIAETAITSETTKICAAIATRASTSIGALTKTLNTSCAAVQATLTTSFAADVVGHIGSRAQNRSAIERLQSAGKLTEGESEAVVGMIEEAHARDIEDSRLYMEAAKGAVRRLHATALSGIQSARSTLDQ